jgi:hypothetical protein
MLGDDPTIADDTVLWRRIRPKQWTPDETQGRLRWRPSSEAFHDSPDHSPMSVFIAAETPQPDHVMRGHTGYGLVGFTAGFARQCGLTVVRDPTQEHPSHALVVGRKTGSVRRRLARASQWVIRPSELPADED